MIGSLGLREQAPLLRTIVTDTAQPASVRRAALGALGVIGERTDAQLVSGCLTDADAGVQAAAQAAQRRLGEQAK